MKFYKYNMAGARQIKTALKMERIMARHDGYMNWASRYDTNQRRSNPGYNGCSAIKVLNRTLGKIGGYLRHPNYYNNQRANLYHGMLLQQMQSYRRKRH